MMTNKLDRLYAYDQSISDMQNAAQAERDAILATVKESLEAVDAKYTDHMKAAHDAYLALEAEIKADVLAHGATVKGEHMMAVYAKGRVSWDTKALDGYAVAHPELQPFRKQGDPSVSIRKV